MIGTRQQVERGDCMQVVRMSRARGMRGGKGYSFSYVQKCLTEVYHNEEIAQLHQELVALRTPIRTNRKPNTRRA